jgi:hypothetical protein
MWPETIADPLTTRMLPLSSLRADVANDSAINAQAVRELMLPSMHVPTAIRLDGRLLFYRT